MRQNNVLYHKAALAGQLHQVLCLVGREIVKHQHLPAIEDGELLRLLFIFLLADKYYKEGTLRTTVVLVEYYLSLANRLSTLVSFHG